MLIVRHAVEKLVIGRAPLTADPKRSPQSLIAPRRESQQQSKAAPRRAGPELRRDREFAGHRSRGFGATIRPDTTAILTSRSM